MILIAFTRTFSAAHRIWTDDSPCRRIHGHNYRVQVEISTGGVLTEQGFVVPWAKVKGVIDQLDHRLLLQKDDPMVMAVVAAMIDEPNDGVITFPEQPSTENLAAYLAERIWHLLPEGGVVTVSLRETDSIEAKAHHGS